MIMMDCWLIGGRVVKLANLTHDWLVMITVCFQSLHNNHIIRVYITLLKRKVLNKQIKHETKFEMS